MVSYTSNYATENQFGFQLCKWKKLRQLVSGNVASIKKSGALAQKRIAAYLWNEPSENIKPVYGVQKFYVNGWKTRFHHNARWSRRTLWCDGKMYITWVRSAKVVEWTKMTSWICIDGGSGTSGRMCFFFTVFAQGCSGHMLNLVHGCWQSEAALMRFPHY